jgi:hypothetical protein
MKMAFKFSVGAAAFLMLLAASAVAFAQNPVVLIVSQAENEDAKKSFVDLSPYLEPAIREAGKYDSIVYKSTLPAVIAALQQKTLTREDLMEPLSRDAARKVARVVGALYLLNVSATNTKEGVAAKADMDYLVGQSTWSTILNARFSPPKPSQGNRPSLLEGIHGHVAAIMDRLNTAGVGSGPGTSHTEESGRGTPFSTSDKTDKSDKTSTKPNTKPDTKAVKPGKGPKNDKTIPSGPGAAKINELPTPPIPVPQNNVPNTNIAQPPVNAVPIRHASSISTY